MKFKNLGLNDDIVMAIRDLGYDNPTPIQEKIIPSILDGNHDLVGLAQTGTGKTAAFGLPLVHLINFEEKHVQGLVLSPTRELCMQITGDIESYTKYISHANVVAVYGGASIEGQIRQIKKGAQIIVATPGRLVDLIERKAVSLSAIRYVVLDEADEMLNMGFKDDLDYILATTPIEKRTWLFSATMPREVSQIARKYMANLVEISVGNKNAGAENIEHIYYVVQDRDKYLALKRILDFYPDIYGLIFCRTRRDTQEIAEKLLKDGYNAEALHGDLSQSQRDTVMRKFREKSLQMLIATDVAARGIDVDDITHVLNYNMPDEPEQYIHRSGRTARAGKSGISIVITNQRDQSKIRFLEQKTGRPFTFAKVPSGNEVCERQLFRMIQKMVSVDVNEAEIAHFMPAIFETLKDYSKEDIIHRFVSIEFNHFLDYYRGARDLNISSERKKTDRPAERNRYKSEQKYRERRSGSRFFINFGERDNITKSTIVRFLCDEAGISNNNIGTIDLKREFSFFEIDEDVAPKVFASLQGTRLDGRPVRVEPASGERKSESRREGRERYNDHRGENRRENSRYGRRDNGRNNKNDRSRKGRRR